MKILFIVLGIIGVIATLLFLYCLCAISSRCSEIEEGDYQDK